MFKSIFQKYRNECIAAVLLVVTYLPVFFWMWDRWFARDSYYSHGILVPFVSIYLIWQERERLAKIPKVSSAFGIPLIVVGILLYIAASVMRVFFISGFSMLIVLAGLVLYFFGSRIFKEIIFPLAFLVFMVPLPEVTIINLSFRLKLFAAQIAAAVLNGVGIAALREGSVIRMYHAEVVVDDVCSGLRSLISLGALGALLAYWMKDSFVKRTVLFLSTIPIAVVTNVVRVVTLSVISEIWGAQYATGFVHDATGFMVFALAFVLLMVVKKLLE